MRIALFTDTYAPQVNGVALTLGRWVRHAAAAGHEVALITPRIAGAGADGVPLRIELPSVVVPKYPELRLAAPLDPWSARRLRAFAPHVAHIATEFTVGWSGLGWAEAAGLPIATSFHTDFPAYLAGYGFGGLERTAWRYLCRFHGRARVTFCPSTATREQLRGHGFAGRIEMWSRGVDAVQFSPARRDTGCREALAPGAGHVLLYVGRLAPEKRVLLLLDAFERVRLERPDAALVIVGDGPSAADLRKRAGAGVHFTGFLSGDSLSRAYAAADAFVFPSDTETFGNVVTEAMASGLPVVAVARGGVLDSVRHEENGLLARPGDAADLAAAALRLLVDGALRARLAAAARRDAERRSWARIMDDLFAVYVELVQAERALTAVA